MIKLLTVTSKQLVDFIIFIQKDWQVFGPQKIGDSILIDKISQPEKLVLGKQIPVYPFKKFFIPGCEDIFEYRAEKLKKPQNGAKVALLGMNILDLEGVLLYDLVFKDDPYYQQRRKNILIMAHDAVPDKKHNFFGKKFSPALLRQLLYDIFLIKRGAQTYKVVAGSALGKKTLNGFGYKKYIDLSKHRVPQPKLSPEEKKIQQAFVKSADSKLWQDLGGKCLECGKCTLVCPTCFCFRIDDQAKLGPDRAQRGDQPAIQKSQGVRVRCWDSCFYHDFSEIGGGFKFLKNTAERLRFWYEHKFLRIPQEYGMLGCVGCGRCTKVCPADIDIEKNLKKIQK